MVAPSARGSVGSFVGAVLSASLILLFVLPLVVLFLYVGWSGFVQEATNDGFLTSIRFTLLASGIAVGLGLLTGVPLGYVLARYRFRGRSFVESAVLLPVVIPHLVVGIALLLLFAPDGPVGRFMAGLGLPVFDAIWGVVLVMLYVGASYVVLASQLAFRAVDPEVVDTARSLGASPGEAFATVTLPQSARGIATGALLMWARGVSEIGGFLILAYAIEPSPPWFGPPTAPASVYIYDLYQSSGGLEAAAAASCVLVLVALAIFLAVRLVDRAGLYTPRGGWLS
ncbi:MAG: ABC transporter permease [Candidatus Thermoplasmatota archaeon]|nr:ABC transporter permease [Candidatus Thermoplasmatota archaeon]